MCIFLNSVSWVVGMCLSEPQVCLSIPTVHSVCLSLGTSGDNSALLFSKMIALPCSLPGNAV